MIPVFITGIGTDVGKTLVSAVVTAALKADYWKPVQAGSLENTDSHFVKQLLDDQVLCHQETYRFQMAASPHIASRSENISLSIEKVFSDYGQIRNNYPEQEYLVVEGAGGLLVPLNDTETVADLIVRLGGKTIIVSRNYLGSINHSLLTAAYCREKNIPVLGWIFTDEYMGYEEEIGRRTNLPVLGKIPFLPVITKDIILSLAAQMREPLLAALKQKA